MPYIFLAIFVVFFGRIALRGYREGLFPLQHGRLVRREKDVFGYWFMLIGFTFASIGCLALILLASAGYVVLK